MRLDVLAATCLINHFFELDEPAKPSKTVGHSIKTILTGVAFCFYGYCQHMWRYLRHTWCSIAKEGRARAKSVLVSLLVL